MEGLWQNPRRLYSRGADCRGLAIDANGVILGPSRELVRKTAMGYSALGASELSEGFQDFSEIRANPGWVAQRLAAVARALDSGDLVHAQLLGLQLPFASSIISPDCLGMDLAKANYDEDETRDADGEWATIGGAGALAPTLPRIGLAEASEIGTAGRIGIGALVGEAVGFLVGTVYPSGQWLTYQGTLPDHPEIDYRYDEGDLSLYRNGADGKPTLLYQARADQDQLYRDGQGNVVGTDLGHGFRVDADRIIAASDAEARTQVDAATSTDEPQICPDPGPDHPHGASPQALAYQWQITGLPLGLAVSLNGQVYDGCDPRSGNMQEAKGPGYQRLTYLGAPWRREIEPPAGAVVEETPDGGLLMIATLEPFDPQNPAHAAAAYAIHMSLAPLWQEGLF